MRATVSTACLVCVVGAMTLSAQAPVSVTNAAIRRFPYPFGHMVAIASDVDVQAPWHGAAIHRTINEEIALPLSDSLWVQGSFTDASSLLLGGEDLNERPSGVGTHTTFGLLLREWHRGNVDTFHSWQDDSVPPLEQRLATPVPLASATTAIPIAPAPTVLAGLYYRHLRLYFSAPPPDDLSLRLYTDQQPPLIATVAQVRAGLSVDADRTKPPYMIEILMGVPQDEGLPVTRDRADLARLRRIELHADSCANGCQAAVTRVVRDSFSRRSVVMQLPWLAAFNIRPAVVTSHGGWSYAQNFDAENFSLTMPRAPGSMYESELVPNVLRNRGNDPSSHAYHSDLLSDFGVNTLWSFTKTSKHWWNRPDFGTATGIRGFHALMRMTVEYQATTLEEFRRELPTIEPGLKRVPLDDIFCAKLCGGDQGSVIGLLVALSLARIDSGRETDNLWYTHFASGDSDFQRSAATPLRPSAVDWLKKLSNQMFNFDHRVLPTRRVWVAPVGTIARYRIARSQIGGHVAVDAKTSRVTIGTWKDPVTRKLMPDATGGMRDLHGITVYVPDATAASVMVAGKQSVSFTRNAPDESGRQSVTLVDDSTPTAIVDEVPLAVTGGVQVSGGEWSDLDRPRAGSARGDTFGELTASGGDAVVRWQPGQLALWNTSHIEMAVRRAGAARAMPAGRLFLELEMADGGVIAMIEDPTPQELATKAVWSIRRQPTAQWWTQLLSVADLRWPTTPSGRRPPLPIGLVREIRFGLRGAAAGERLDLDSVRALRPNGNNTAPDGHKIIGGQVVSGGKVVPSVVVEATRPDGSRVSTVTDRNGYYFFVNQPANEVLQVAALSAGRRCTPLAGSMIQVTRDQPELDIDLGRCR